MPILWRYLIKNFLTITFFCVLGFIAILLTMRLDEIAHFAALGAPFNCILIFTYHQIPYILPIAIPLSCLIASLIIVQRMSNLHEVSALRASGFSFRDIFTPLWIAAFFLALINFWIVSEVATFTHSQNNQLKTELRSINPLLILHNKHLMRLKGFYFESLGSSKVGESASDAILALPNVKQRRLNLLIAKKMTANAKKFSGEKISLITIREGESFDGLIIENMKKASTNVNSFAGTLKKKIASFNDDYLQMPLLLARIREEIKEIKNAAEIGNKEKFLSLKVEFNKSVSEIVKRFSIALAVITFTIMGTSLGISIGRKKSYFSLSLTIGFTALFLASFFMAKSNDRVILLSSLLYLVPHVIITFVSFFVIRRMTNGIV